MLSALVRFSQEAHFYVQTGVSNGRNGQARAGAVPGNFQYGGAVLRQLQLPDPGCDPHPDAGPVVGQQGLQLVVGADAAAQSGCHPQPLYRQLRQNTDRRHGGCSGTGQAGY